MRAQPAGAEPAVPLLSFQRTFVNGEIPFVLVDVAAEVNVHAVLVEHVLHGILKRAVDFAPLVHGVVAADKNPGAHMTLCNRALEVVLQPRQLVAKAAAGQHVWEEMKQREGG